MKIKIFETDEAEKVIKWVARHYDDYRNQREDIDEAYEISDFQYKCGTARGEFNAEKRKWVPRYAEGKANVGSLLFHRQVNTLAGILGAVLMSGRELWKYRTKPVQGNPEAGETGAHTAAAVNTLSKWVQKQDKFGTKIPELCTAIFKQSNIFMMVSMRQEERWVVEGTMVDEPVEDFDGRPIIDGDTGQPLTMQRKVFKRVKKKISFPTFTVPYPRNVYADKYISHIEDQECVIVLTTTTRHKLMSEGKWLDQKAVRGLDMSKVTWDRTHGAEGKDSDAEHLHRDIGETSDGLILRWDFYAYVPVKDGKMYDPDAEVQQGFDREKEESDDDDNQFDMKLVWGVAVGNTLEEAVCLKIVDVFDPDGEIPIKEIRAIPDDGDMLYHTSFGEVVRSMYAADCTLLGAALDNNAVVNDPPLKILRGRHGVKDFTFKSGAKWMVDQVNAVEQMEVRDTTMNTVMLRDQVRADTKKAMATDDAKLGEYAGARTSATEIMQVTGATDTTLALRNAYITHQLLEWMGRKHLSYIREYMEDEMVQQIIGESMPEKVRGGEFFGEYDVVVDIVGQYENDQKKEMSLDRTMQVLGANPAFMQSENHSIDIGELITMYLETKGIPVGRIIKPGGAVDSEANARARVDALLRTGVYIPPKQGENHAVHLRVARAERMRWRGISPGADPRMDNLELIDMYIEDLGQMDQQQQQPQDGGGGGEVMGDQTQGQMAGNEMAAELGAQMGGF